MKAAQTSNAPLNVSQVVGSSYGSDDDSCEVAGRESRKTRAGASSVVIEINDNPPDEEPAPKESEETERGMILSHESIMKIVNIELLTQIAFRRTGTHRFMHSFTQSRRLTTLVTRLDVFTSSSATQNPVKAKARPEDTSGGILILQMGSQRAIFAAMQSYVGAKRPLQGRML